MWFVFIILGNTTGTSQLRAKPKFSSPFNSKWLMAGRPFYVLIFSVPSPRLGLGPRPVTSQCCWSTSSYSLLQKHVIQQLPKCMYVYIGFKTFFYAVRHLHSTASYLPTGLHLGVFRSWPSLFLPSSFSSVFLVLSFVSASTSTVTQMQVENDQRELRAYTVN